MAKGPTPSDQQKQAARIAAELQQRFAQKPQSQQASQAGNGPRNNPPATPTTAAAGGASASAAGSPMNPTTPSTPPTSRQSISNEGLGTLIQNIAGAKSTMFVNKLIPIITANTVSAHQYRAALEQKAKK